MGSTHTSTHTHTHVGICVDPIDTLDHSAVDSTLITYQCPLLHTIQMLFPSTIITLRTHPPLRLHADGSQQVLQTSWFLTAAVLIALHQQQGHSEAGPKGRAKGHREQGSSSSSTGEQAALLSASVGACKEVVGRLEALVEDIGSITEGCRGYREKCHALIMQIMQSQ